MFKIRDLIKNNVREYTMGFALILIVILFQALTGGVLLRPLNITNLILQNSYVLILAMGMLLCIISGGNIDLSVGSVVAFIGALSGILIINLNMPVLPAIVLCLMAGVGIGAWQGFWIAAVKIPSFIVTLAGMLMFRGLTLVLLNGRTLGPFPESFQFISSGFIPDMIESGSLHMITVVIGILFSLVFMMTSITKHSQKKKYGFETPSMLSLIITIILGIAIINVFTITIASYKGISAIMIILIALIFVYSFITKRSVFGRHIYAMGGNDKAAKLSGIKTGKVLFLVYTNMAVLSALAGIVIAGRLNAATPKAGNGFELDAIAACFIGGASTTGGIGTVFGAIVGALIMGTLNNGMSIMGVSVDWQQAIKGLVLLLAVALDTYTKNRAKG